MGSSMFNNRGNVAVQAGQQHVYGDVNINLIQRDELQLLEQLPYAAQAAFNSRDKEHDPFCVPDTRTDILKQIREWVNGSENSYIFWLNV
ncbi:hypothetical protein AOQ84DRAFT_386413 [Glonium stellatum]|uniref:Uncharacterized protein n=1 Tax=Glonium stellatum TaxID=574774 RepID=A0A8E2JWA5_9PEZI|nr:hypothetical protein AOQ84DRAFT_386413 [Glonium stellatum]